MVTEIGHACTRSLSASVIPGSLDDIMSHSALAQADLFGTVHEDRGPSRSAIVPNRGRRATSPPDPEGAARFLDAHDDYRVLRRLKPRPVDPPTGSGPGRASRCWSTSKRPASTTATTR